ncbi:hypothetical protein DTO169E5_6149 [Paecilomyces variotii]|nr:hypothetical protein DTO169E5_6149 [Paecilomyces variotii]
MEVRIYTSKRRRTDNGYVDPVNDSSSDELAAVSDHETDRRRASWSAQKAYKSRRSYQRSPRLSDSGSSDELAVDAGTYWRESKRRRSRSRSGSRSRSRGRSPSHDDRAGGSGPPEEKSEQQSEEYDERQEEPGAEDRNIQPAVRTPSPLPPPPPPKPERLNYRVRSILKGHLRGVSAAKFSPDGSMIASGGADAAVKVWDTLSGKLIHTFEGHLAGISTISWSPDGEIIASGSDDKTIRLWNVLTGKAHPIPFVGHHNYVYAIAFSPKGNMLVSGSYDEAVFLWDVRSASVMRSLPAHSDPVGGIDVVRDGTLIASCASDGLIRIWDTATGQCLRTIVHEDNPPVMSVKFSPNGKFVLAWTLDNCVRLWNYVEGRCIKTYQGHVNLKYGLCGGFGIYGAPGGKPEAFAVSGSEDGAILCWDVVSKKVLQRIEAHTDVVLGVDTCCIGDKRLMVSCGLDRTVRIWEEFPEDEGENENEAPEAKINGVGEEENNSSSMSASVAEPDKGAETNGDGMIE